MEGEVREVQAGDSARLHKKKSGRLISAEHDTATLVTTGQQGHVVRDDGLGETLRIRERRRVCSRSLFVARQG